MKKCLLLIGLVPTLVLAAAKDDLALLAHQLLTIQGAVVPGAAAQPKAGARGEDKKAAAAEDYEEQLRTVRGYVHGRIQHTVEQADASLKQLAEVLKTASADKKDEIQKLYTGLEALFLQKILTEFSDYQVMTWPINMENFQKDKAAHADDIYYLIKTHKAALEQNKQLYGAQRILALLDTPEVAAAAAKDKAAEDKWQQEVKERQENSPEGQAAKLRAEKEPQMAAELKAQDALFDPLAKLGAFKVKDNVFAARQKMMLDEELARITALFLPSSTLSFIALYRALEDDINICKNYIEHGSKLATLSMKNKIDGFVWCQKLMDFDLKLHNLFSDYYLMSWDRYKEYQERVPKELKDTKSALHQAELALVIPDVDARDLVVLWHNFDMRRQGMSDRSPYEAALGIEKLSKQYNKELEAAAQAGNSAAKFYLDRLKGAAYINTLARGY